MRLLCGEKIDGGIRILGAYQFDALQRQYTLVPPVFVAYETGPLCIGQKQIRSGSQRNSILLCAGFDDGDVKQRGERAVRPAQRDVERVAADAHGHDVVKARGIAF